MNLLITYLLSLLVTQSLAIGVALIVDRMFSPHAGLIVFIVLYFVMFWVGWKVSVWLTEPKTPSNTPNTA